MTTELCAFTTFSLRDAYRPVTGGQDSLSFPGEAPSSRPALRHWVSSLRGIPCPPTSTHPSLGSHVHTQPLESDASVVGHLVASRPSVSTFDKINSISVKTERKKPRFTSLSSTRPLPGGGEGEPSSQPEKT